MRALYGIVDDVLPWSWAWAPCWPYSRSVLPMLLFTAVFVHTVTPRSGPSLKRLHMGASDGDDPDTDGAAAADEEDEGPGADEKRARRTQLRAGKAGATPSSPSLDASSTGDGSNSMRTPFRGVSFVAKRRQWQAQITVSDKVHLGNYKQQEMAAHAVSFAKAQLRNHGFTVKLLDNDAEPVTWPLLCC